MYWNFPNSWSKSYDLWYNRTIESRVNYTIWVRNYSFRVKTNVLGDLKQFKDDFNVSEWDRHHELFDPINKNVIAKTKVETSPVLEFDKVIVLRSKSCSYSQQTQQSKQKECKKHPILKIMNHHDSKIIHWQNKLFHTLKLTSRNGWKSTQTSCNAFLKITVCIWVPQNVYQWLVILIKSLSKYLKYKVLYFVFQRLASNLTH